MEHHCTRAGEGVIELQGGMMGCFLVFAEAGVSSGLCGRQGASKQ